MRSSDGAAGGGGGGGGTAERTGKLAGSFRRARARFKAYSLENGRPMPWMPEDIFGHAHVVGQACMVLAGAGVGGQTPWCILQGRPARNGYLRKRGLL
jgi:hypothetical protein